jgi:hypothetical protein
MKNIHEIRAILSASTKRIRVNRAPDGYAYSAGWLESTLADAIDELAKHDLNAAERILHRVETVK